MCRNLAFLVLSASLGLLATSCVQGDDENVDSVPGPHQQPAAADEPELFGRCPDSFDLMTDAEALQFAPQVGGLTGLAFIESIDKNGDGYVCVKQLKPHHNLIDNNARIKR